MGEELIEGYSECGGHGGVQVGAGAIGVAACAHLAVVALFRREGLLNLTSLRGSAALRPSAGKAHANLSEEEAVDRQEEVALPG